MKKNEVLDSIGYVDVQLIHKAESYVPAKKKRGWLRWGAMAACLCLIAAAAFSAPELLGPDMIDTPGKPVESDSQGRNDDPQNTSVPGMSGSVSEKSDVSEKPEVMQTDPLENTTDPKTPAVTQEAPGNAAENPPAMDPGRSDMTDPENVPRNDPAVLQGPFQGEDHPTPPMQVIPMIESYGNATYTDLAVNNGGCLLSASLQAAMGEYGDNTRYRVLVELFRDGVQIDSGSDEAKAEMDRLAAEGYTVAFEKYNDGYTEHCYFTLHATADQLSHFSVSGSYGYSIMLYGDFFGVSGGSAVVFNGFMN